MSEEVPTTPVFEDNNRKGYTRGEAIFGDKQADLVADTAPEVAEVIEDNELGKSEAAEAASHAAALLAMHQEGQHANRVRDIEAQAAREDWPQDRLDAAMANLSQRSGPSA